MDSGVSIMVSNFYFVDCLLIYPTFLDKKKINPCQQCEATTSSPPVLLH